MRQRPARYKRLFQSFKIPKISIPWLLTGIYALGILFLIVGPFFRLKHFNCLSNTQVNCPDFVLPELEKYRNEIVFFIQYTDIAQKLEKNLSGSDFVIVNPEWPDKLTAHITWQHAVANVGIPASTSALLIGNNGLILAHNTSPDPNLPTIIASSAADLIISDQITEPSLVAAFEIVKDFEMVNLKTKYINVISSQNIEVYLEKNRIALFTSQKSIAQQVHTLQLILAQATMNPELKIIDLRLDRPALKPVE